jgi:hypothetical protein
MSDVHKSHAIRKLATGAWTPVVVPIACCQIVILNEDANNAQAIRTDQNDGDTELTLLGGKQYVIASTAQSTPFNPGDVVCYVLATSGSGPVAVSFVR